MISKASVKRIASNGEYKVNSNAINYIVELAETQIKDIGERGVNATKHRKASVMKFKDVDFVTTVAIPSSSKRNDKELSIISSVEFNTKLEGGNVVPVLLDSTQISKNSLGKEIKTLTDFKIGNDAKIALAQVAEHYISEVFKKSDLLRQAASRTFIKEIDINAALGIEIVSVAE